MVGCPGSKKKTNDVVIMMIRCLEGRQKSAQMKLVDPQAHTHADAHTGLKLFVDIDHTVG
jgi:hypothetical protein